MGAALTKYEDRAYRKGYVAGQRREPIGSSPYKRGVVAQFWLKGWIDGTKDPVPVRTEGDW